MAKRSKKQPSLRAQWLGRGLRDLRDSRGLKIADVAGFLGRVDGTVSHYESGNYRIPEQDLLLMLDQYDVTDPGDRAYFIQLNEEVRQRGWWDGYKKYLGDSFADYLWLEANAAVMRILGLTFLDGLLQTQEYAQALIGRGPQTHDPEHVKRLVEARVLRSRVLDKPDRRFAFLLHEAALDLQIGGPEVMGGQYRKLLELSDSDRIEIRVLPRTASGHVAAGITTSFTHFELADPLPDVACVETPAGAIYLESPDIDLFEQTFAQLWADEALGERDSLQQIKTRLKDVKR